jgi:hypothetical protein
MQATIISDTSCLILLDKIKQTNFRLSEQLELAVLKNAGE